MAIPNKQIGWSNESNLLWLVLKQITKLTQVVFSLRPNYKIYNSLVSQTGTDDPTTIVLNNSLGTITWAYQDVGQISANSAGLFTVDKTVSPSGTFYLSGTVYSYSVASMDANQIIYNIVDIFSTPTDGVLTNIPIEIIVYN